MDPPTRKEKPAEYQFRLLVGKVDRLIPPEMNTQDFIAAVQAVIDHYLHSPEAPD